MTVFLHCRTRCRSTGKRRLGRAGFSLVELAIVCSVLGILILLTTPAWQQYIENQRLAEGADAIAMKLLLARQKAVTEGNDFILTYDASTGTYRLHDDDNNNGTYDTGEWRDAQRDLPVGVVIDTHTFASQSITFSRNGSASETGNLVLENGRGNRIRVEVIAATGKITTDRI
jgi:prepilin-type N-terminal cleavage/methylation domain-containing protein